MPRLEADAYAELTDAASIATVSALFAEFAVGAPLISWKAEKPSAAFSLVLGEVHRSCLRSEFIRGGSG